MCQFDLSKSTVPFSKLASLRFLLVLESSWPMTSVVPSFCVEGIIVVGMAVTTVSRSSVDAVANRNL